MAGDGTEELRTGLAVRGADGRRLGTLVGLDAGVLVVERGFFWPQRFTVSRSDVGAVKDGEVRLLGGAALRETHTGALLSEPAQARESLARETSGASVREEGDDVRVPLAREDAYPLLRMRDVGAVRVRKVVRTELKQLTVEVRREELVVERLPVQPGATAAPEGTPAGAFEELEQVIPLWREDVEVVKRAVVYEEVHLKKAVERRTWTEEVPLRQEVARVEEEGDARLDVGDVRSDSHSH
ncbi:MAG TPA: YsnF/AvaK domain-containing protein [Archangium sp.]|uniref:YsnF/AvaK domain-containing protein n=1 Tax=Archangium sp. TaxID=1872627 RepID=UPI002E3175EA|nr:YsnF/AvaK domain-containing protein [Archangium sp.]HEX5747182.1 YsnF/AvaK domain-containing protein [Archangium sp.]